MTNDLNEIIRLIRLAAVHRRMSEQGRAIREAVSRLAAIGLTIDDILHEPAEITVLPIAVPPPKTRPKPPLLPPAKEIAGLINHARSNKTPIERLFTMFYNSGWDYTSKATAYPPSRMKEWVKDVIDSPHTMRINDFVKRQQGLINLAINGWIEWYEKHNGSLPKTKPSTQLNDPLSDLFTEPLQ